MRIVHVSDYILWCWHPILGALIPVFGSVEIVYGVIWFTGLMIYQVTEGRKPPYGAGDVPYRDIREILIGLGVALAYLVYRKYWV